MQWLSSGSGGLWGVRLLVEGHLIKVSTVSVPVSLLSLSPSLSHALVLILHSWQCIMKVYKPLPIRLLTHNIRYATNSPFKGEEKWIIRKPRLINELSFHTAHAESFICLQEVLHQQLLDILSGLNSGLDSEKKVWDYVGVGRDDGAQGTSRHMNLSAPRPVLQIHLLLQIGNADSEICVAGEYSPICTYFPSPCLSPLWHQI